jgi:preprotein translocase subunit YajC
LLDTTILLISTTLESNVIGGEIFDGGVMLLANLFGQAEEVAPAVAEPEMSPIQRILFHPLVLPIGLFLLFYMTFIAPERRRKAEEAKLMSSLKKNDRVVTIGGIHGTIVAAAADSKVVTLKIDESGNTRIKVNRSAIASVLAPSSESKDSTD